MSVVEGWIRMKLDPLKDNALDESVERVTSTAILCRTRPTSTQRRISIHAFHVRFDVLIVSVTRCIVALTGVEMRTAFDAPLRGQTRIGRAWRMIHLIVRLARFILSRAREIPAIFW